MSAFDDDNDCVFTKGPSAWSASDVLYGVTHILPLDDAVAHELDHGCVCGPAVEDVVVVGRTDGWEMVKHHALVQ